MRYVHYSSRPDLPQVPPRAINAFAGGTGPLGVYAYPLDAAHTFAADRAYAFELVPTVPVTSTRTYTAADLERDLDKLGELVDISRPLRLWSKYHREIRHSTLPFVKLWYVLARIPHPDADDEDVLPSGSDTAAFYAPALGRDLLVKLGHRVIDDRLGILYASEPAQAVFLTDTSFKATPMSKQKNPTLSRKDIEEEIASVERAHVKWRRERDAKIAQIEGIFAATPAIRGDFHGQPRMAIKSGELSDRGAGSIRVTFFGEDGPHGHVTKKTDRDAAEAVLDFMHEPFSAMADADVMEWTTTPTFERGSRIIALIQAENTLRFYAQRAGRIDWAYDIIRARGGMQFDEVSLDELDAEIARLAAAIRELPVPNPSASGFVRNPAWVTGALADHYELLEDKVPTRWLPRLRNVDHHRDDIVAEFTEFGCGAYGCVLATNDLETVLKVTSDETEAEFASTLANELSAPICVEYRMVVRLSAERDGVPIHLLWREAADHVGNIDKALGARDADKGYLAKLLIQTQHLAAQDAYAAIQDGLAPAVIAAAIRRWLEAVDRWNKQRAVPELWPLARGILDVWEAQHVLFGDIHPGNVGYVAHRDAWVITDPGNIAVISDPELW